MIPTEIVIRFNTVRALVFCSSPQVKEHDGHIVMLDEHGKPDCVVAKLGHNYSFDDFCIAVHRDVSKIALTELPESAGENRYAIIQKRNTDDSITFRHLAYMLPS